MSFALINRSPDLQRLQNAGYSVRIVGSYLAIDDVPYVNEQGIVCHASLVSKLTLSGDQTTRPEDHVAYFSGSAPCNKDGSIIEGLRHGDVQQDLGSGLVVQRSFSNKPPGGYPDYFEKMTRYITVISAPAQAVDPQFQATVYKPIPAADVESPFVYLDTNSGRAMIGAISAKLERLRIGIVGLGGTGSYILDLIAKTPVAEIRLFDGDRLLQHNAFRAPGATPLEKLQERPLKVELWKDVYGKMHKGIIAVSEFVTAENAFKLHGLDFVFLSMDASPAKLQVLEYLMSRGITVIDAGLGVQAVDGKLLGIVRVTTVTQEKHDHFSKISCIDTGDDDYSTNIQIAELNMLNAVMAVVRWKKMVGFYVDYEHEHHSTYTLSGNMILSEDTAA